MKIFGVGNPLLDERSSHQCRSDNKELDRRWISAGARLLYAKGVAGYIVFLAEHTGLVAAERCAAVRRLLGRIETHDEFLDEISK